MKSPLILVRWASAAVLAAASGAAAAAPLWIDNESFGFESCAALSRVPAAEDAPATLAALRSSAESDLRRAAELGGLMSDLGPQVMVTPVSGSFACGARPSELTLRVATVDTSGAYRSAEFVVIGGEASTPQPAIVALAHQLSRTLRGTVAQATLR